MIRALLYFTAFLIGAALYAALFSGAVLAVWAAAHFVSWTPFAKIPWWSLRLAVAGALYKGVEFAIKEGGK